MSQENVEIVRRVTRSSTDGRTGADLSIPKRWRRPSGRASIPMLSCTNAPSCPMRRSIGARTRRRSSRARPAGIRGRSAGSRSSSWTSVSGRGGDESRGPGARERGPDRDGRDRRLLVPQRDDRSPAGFATKAEALEAAGCRRRRGLGGKREMVRTALDAWSGGARSSALPGDLAVAVTDRRDG